MINQLHAPAALPQNRCGWVVTSAGPDALEKINVWTEPRLLSPPELSLLLRRRYIQTKRHFGCLRRPLTDCFQVCRMIHQATIPVSWPLHYHAKLLVPISVMRNYHLCNMGEGICKYKVNRGIGQHQKKQWIRVASPSPIALGLPSWSHSCVAWYCQCGVTQCVQNSHMGLC